MVSLINKDTEFVKRAELSYYFDKEKEEILFYLYWDNKNNRPILKLFDEYYCFHIEGDQYVVTYYDICNKLFHGETTIEYTLAFYDNIKKETSPDNFLKEKVHNNIEFYTDVISPYYY